MLVIAGWGLLWRTWWSIVETWQNSQVASVTWQDTLLPSVTWQDVQPVSLTGVTWQRVEVDNLDHLEVSGMNFQEWLGVSPVDLTMASYGSYVMLYYLNDRTNLIQGSQSSMLGDERGIDHRVSVADADLWMQINIGREFTGRISFCLDNSRCKDLLPVPWYDAILLPLADVLKPWLNTFLVQVFDDKSAETPTFKHQVYITYMAYGVSLQWETVGTWDSTPFFSMFSECYQGERVPGDDQKIMACEKSIKERMTLSKNAACELPDGIVDNRFLTVGWSENGKSAEVFGWLKKNDTLYYSVNVWNSPNEANCESPSYEVHLFTYDCSTEQSKEMYEFPNVGIAAWNCGVTVAGVSENNLLYRMRAYEWNGSIYEGFEWIDLDTKKTKKVAFTLNEDDAQKLESTSQLSQEDRDYILKDVNAITTAYFGLRLAGDGISMVDDIAYGYFWISDVTDTTMSLKWTFSEARSSWPDGVQYTLAKTYSLVKTSFGWAVKK